MTLIDLTMAINEETPAFPGDPKGEFKRIAICEKDGWNEHRICTSTHFGTHIDAPWHFLENGGTIDELAFSDLLGPVTVAEIVDKQHISAMDLQSLGLAVQRGALLRSESGPLRQP